MSELLVGIVGGRNCADGSGATASFSLSCSGEATKLVRKSELDSLKASVLGASMGDCIRASDEELRARRANEFEVGRRGEAELFELASDWRSQRRLRPFFGELLVGGKKERKAG